MNGSDFVDVINLKNESKEYRLVENGKSEKFKKYTDWEKHILSLFSGFPDQEDLRNFKIYCAKNVRNREGYFENGFSFFALLYAVVLTLSLPKNYYYGIAYVLPVYGIFIWFVHERRKKFFYQDVLTVIEKYEKDNAI